MISGILLAAGESRRMGSLKPLLPYGRSTIIEEIAQTLLESELDEVRVVLGHRQDEIARALTGKALHLVVNYHYQEGMLSSIQCGISSLSNDIEAVLLALVDQPFIFQAMINLLIERYKRGGKGIVIPIYKGKRGHPIIISMKYREEILNLDKEHGLRELMYAHPDDILEVESESELILQDLDYHEDYLKELERLKGSRSR